VWRVTHLLAREDGPGQCLVWLRRKLGAGFWGQLMDCFYCLSLWVAAPAAFWMSQSWMERVFFWFALSAAAILVDRLHREPVIIQRLNKEEL
jgi:hypothetical protein